MADSGWDSETVATVRKYAMQNTVEYDGAGQAGSVLGRLLGERGDLRPRARELKYLVEKEVEAAKAARLKELEPVAQKIAKNYEGQWRYLIKQMPEEIERGKFGKDWTARIMGIATVGGFLAYIFLVTLQPPEQNS